MKRLSQTIERIVFALPRALRRLLSALRPTLDEVARPRPAAAPFFRAKRLLRLAVAGVLIAGGLGWAADWWVVRSSRGRIFERVAEVPKRHTAIVLGARVYPDGTPSAILADRLLTALDLYRGGRVERILVSGDHGSEDYDEVNAMRRFLARRGVPDGDIFMDHAGFRTLDTMLRAAAVFEVEAAVICTQRFHLPRSVFLARRADIDAVGMVSDRRPYRHHRINLAREFAARTVSVLDTYLLERQPRFYGETIPIHGDGRRSHDR